MSKPTRLKSTRKITSTIKISQYKIKSCDQTRKIKTNEQNHINNPILKTRIKSFDQSQKYKTKGHNCFNEILKEVGKINKSKVLPNYRD